MISFKTLVLAFAVVPLASGESRLCQNLTIPVTVVSRNAMFGNVATPQTNLDATAFALNSTRQGANFTNLALTGYHDVQGNYNISAKLCLPNSDGSISGLQILNHGIGFDKTYWDLSFNGYNYSYTDVALSHGFATLAIDRLGIGLSSHGEPRDEIQSFLEVESLAEITRIARRGDLPGAQGHPFFPVIHVGHSFGSAQIYSLATKYSNLTDGIVLTGFSMNASFVGLFGAGNDLQQANINQPLRFGSPKVVESVEYIVQTFSLTDYLAPLDLRSIAGETLDYPNGYLVNSNAAALNYLHFYSYNFDPMILLFAEQTKQPAAIGELLTLASLPERNEYSGPVLVFTGEHDLPYCGGDCLATGGSASSVPEGVRDFFPQARDFTAYIQPNTGHGLSFHYNSTAGFQYIQSWVIDNVLGGPANSY